MSIQTDTSVFPYFDDFKDEKDFYKVLFKPKVPVQIRELNQLQSILQKQIERFGDNIYRRGSIIDGCNINFLDSFPYVKLKDNETNGTPVDVSSYKSKYIKNQSNLVAVVVESISGFESKNPDLNTLYIKYLNSGLDSNTFTFSSDQILTIYDPTLQVNRIRIYNGGSGFSNTDSVVITSALAIQNSAGGKVFSSGFYVGDVITDGVSANLSIVSIDSVSDSSSVILSVKPLTTDLRTANSSSWTFSSNSSIINSNTGQTAIIKNLVGSGATASLITDSVGQISSIYMTSVGANYDVTPLVSISSAVANTSQINSVNAIAETFSAKVSSANSITNPIGVGYAINVGRGVIYQKGYFSRVEEQLTVVEKYNNQPSEKVVGFDTNEDIINSNIDFSLNDNSLGTSNYTGPGADRLKLTPKLIVKTKNESVSNSEFFSIVEFSDGKPFKQNRQTQFESINRELAKRTYEESGNYVIDPFNIISKSPSTLTEEQNTIKLVVDPGIAYVNGNRIETQTNFSFNLDKGKDTVVSNTATVSLNYGSYIKVTNLGGVFNFSIGDQVTLYDTVKNYFSTPGATITSVGTELGTARIRSIVLESGVQGTVGAVYRLYLFNIVMNAGTNFGEVRSIFYNGTNKGIADLVLSFNSASNISYAQLFDAQTSSLAFYSGVDAIKNANNISYVYRSIDETRVANTAGILTKSLGLNEVYPYSGTLSLFDKQELSVIPLANTYFVANASGSVVVTSGSNTIVGTSTDFINSFVPGDYIKIANSTASVVAQVSQIANTTSIKLVSNASGSITGNVSVFFPKNVPISLDSRRSANVSANGSVLTINLGGSLPADANCALIFNARVQNVTPITKTVNRDLFVRIRIANNTTTTSGPWCLGVSDVFRMKKVYIGANNTFLPTDSGIVDATNDFYIDHNQNENFLNSSYLYQKPRAINSVTSGSVLLVKFDAFTTTNDGLKNVLSYPINDSLTLSSSTTSINTMEIPEVYDSRGNYYDLRDVFDLRPSSINVATLTSNAALATINPTEPVEASRFSSFDKKFPAPDSDLTCYLERYVKRVDRVVLDSSGEIKNIKGIPGVETAPPEPVECITIDNIKVPEYPTLPQVLSANTVEIIDTKIANEKYTNKRLEKYRISLTFTDYEKSQEQPKGYTMSEIGKLERRIENLEYYTQLSLAEAASKNRYLPSESVPGTDRFKFGYFVDSFVDYSYSDVYNPEYFAEIEDSKLHPYSDKINIEYELDLTDAYTSDRNNGDLLLLPYEEYTLIDQASCTDGPLLISSVNSALGTISDEVSTTEVLENVTTVKQRTDVVLVGATNNYVDRNYGVTETSEFYLSSEAGPVGIYFSFRDNHNAIEVYYGDSPGFSIVGKTPYRNALNCRPITDYEWYSYCGDFGKRETLNGPYYEGVSNKPTVEDAGVLEFTHDPSLGRYIKVVISKFKKSGNANNWKGKFFYRIKYPTDTVETSLQNVTKTNHKLSYNGVVSYLFPSTFKKQTVYNKYSETSKRFYPLPVSSAQTFDIIVSGLKPNTKHSLVFDGQVMSDQQVKQKGKNYGESLISDINGKIEFTFLYDSSTSSTSSFQQINNYMASVTSTKNFIVKSDDNTSIAEGKILG